MGFATLSIQMHITLVWMLEDLIDRNISSVNGLMNPSNKLLPELVLTKLSDVLCYQYTKYHAYLNTVYQLILSPPFEYTTQSQ